MLVSQQQLLFTHSVRDIPGKPQSSRMFGFTDLHLRPRINYLLEMDITYKIADVRDVYMLVSMRRRWYALFKSQ